MQDITKANNEYLIKHLLPKVGAFDLSKSCSLVWILSWLLTCWVLTRWTSRVYWPNENNLSRTWPFKSTQMCPAFWSCPICLTWWAESWWSGITTRKLKTLSGDHYRISLLCPFYFSRWFLIFVIIQLHIAIIDPFFEGASIEKEPAWSRDQTPRCYLRFGKNI